MMKRVAWFCIVLIAAVQASTEDWTIERFQWSGSPVPGAMVEIVNQHGDVRTRSSSINEIEILANIQRSPDDPYEASIRIAEETDSFRIDVVWDLRENASAGDSTTEMGKRRVDLTVIIPRLSPLVVRTAKGLIEAKGHGAQVTAESRSGEIRVSTEGTVSAQTEHGAIDAILNGADESGSSSFETITGSVTVWLPADAAVTVEAETRGVISTDYSIDIRRAEPDGRKLASATIGDGGSKLQIKTIRGQIRLFRTPK